MLAVRMFECWILCVWWGVWSLADAYLLCFTPWSELFVLAGCGVAAAWALRVDSIEEKVRMQTRDSSSKSEACTFETPKI